MSKSMDLDLLDQSIFAILHATPFKPYSKIANQLQVSPITVQDRVQKMISNGYLISGNEMIDPLLGKRIQSEVRAEYNPSKIGLVRQHVFFDNIKSKETEQILNKFCDIHPYTHYRASLFGGGITVYTQFDVPITIENEMKKVYEKVSEKLGLSSPIILKAQSTIYSNPDFLLYNSYIDDKNEILDELKKINPRITVLEALFQLYKQDTEIKTVKLSDTEKFSINDLDAKLLREMTINGKVKINFLAEIYGRDKSSISRRIKRLKENVIDRGTLRYNHDKYDMSTLQLIIGKTSEKYGINAGQLKEFLEGSNLPFESFLAQEEDRFVLFSTASSGLSNDISSFLWKYTDSAYFKPYQISLKHTFSYYFYYENLDDDGNWKIDKNYYADDPLSTI